ncbi:MAG: hypothetical protein ACFB21_15405, partial [Opitutales bacterium]
MADISLNFLAENLLDVESVQGLVLIDQDNGTVGTMLPAAYQNLDLAEVRSCCDQLFQLVRQTGNDAEELVLEYEDATLFLRSDGRCTLCVLAHSGAEIASLRVAAKLMMRQITNAHLEELSSSAVDGPVQGTRNLQTGGSEGRAAAAPRKPLPPSQARVREQPTVPPVRTASRAPQP